MEDTVTKVGMSIATGSVCLMTSGVSLILFLGIWRSLKEKWQQIRNNKKMNSPHTVQAICSCLSNYNWWESTIHGESGCERTHWRNGSIQISVNRYEDECDLTIIGVGLTQREKEKVMAALDKMQAEKILAEGIRKNELTLNVEVPLPKVVLQT